MSPKPSTRRFFKVADTIPGFPLREKLHGYLYLRYPYFYIGTGIGATWLGRLINAFARTLGKVLPRGKPKPGRITFADTYHGKVMPLQTARELVSINENIRVDDLEHVIPYQLARALILENPDHLVALDCPCRVARENPCLPLDVCLIIGEPFSAFVLEHHSARSRAITRDEAVAILEAEDARGHVHHAFFKEAVLSRFYAICNCCSCCCGAMQAHQHGTPMLASSGFVARVNTELCEGCGTCESICQFHAITVMEGVSRIDESACMGCGVCVSHCPQDAIELAANPERGIPLDMKKLLEGMPSRSR